MIRHNESVLRIHDGSRRIIQITILPSILKLEQDEIIIAQVVKELISVRDGVCFISNLETSCVMSVIYDLCVN